MKNKIEYVLFFSYPRSKAWYPYNECDGRSLTLDSIRSMKKRIESGGIMDAYKFKIVRKTTTFEEMK